MRDFIRILKRFVPLTKVYGSEHRVQCTFRYLEPVFFRLDYPDPSDLV